MEAVVENLENSRQKNNVKIRGLKEGDDLSGFLVELFTSWDGSN